MKAGNFRVLIPIDFSENSREAERYALDHFNGQITHLYLLHTYKENTPGSAPLISLMDILREKSERLMAQEVQFIRSSMVDDTMEIQTFSRFDGFLEGILDIKNRFGIDLVVLGTNGHTHPRMELRDDDPGFLLHRLNLPLLLVPKIAN
ncbi:MAG: hypothetical protein RLZZ165_1083 [Bacteroidota bacterium]|jgi:nucleotide-binding universal stress UspA family protein